MASVEHWSQPPNQTQASTVPSPPMSNLPMELPQQKFVVDTSTVVPFLKVAMFAVGERTVCIFSPSLPQAYTVFARSEYGVLGIGSNDTTLKIGYNSSFPISQNVSLPAQAIDIACGSYHVCALLTTKEVFCWGWNEYVHLKQ